ncbi:MAG: NAD-dependent epimerase/dehydratase family protein, partial [Bradymonadaceae bacterium]
MKYLVTGAAGFIGSHLVERLVDKGHDVVALDNLSTGYRRNVDPFLEEIEFIEGDIRDEQVCHESCDGVDHVLHQAALGSVPRSVERPIDSHACNATGTLNMLVAARDAEVESFVYAASSSVYGNTEELPKRETMKHRPRSPYATSKATGELYLQNFANIYGLSAVGVRYFNVFGPRQDPEGPYAAVIPKFIDLMLEGERPV